MATYQAEYDGQVTAIDRKVGVITLFQNDLSRAIEFYAGVFDKAPDFADSDAAVFHFDNTIINLEREAEAIDRIAPVPVAPQEAGARAILTIWVADADAACAELAKRGVPLINGPTNTPWGTRRAVFADPGGHLWQVAQDLDQQSES